MGKAPYYITAYGIARKNGFCGTEKEWLASLKGVRGDTGPVAKDVPYEFCEKIIIGYEPCEDEVFFDEKTYCFMPNEGIDGYTEELAGGKNYKAGGKNAVFLRTTKGEASFECDKVLREFTDYYNEVEYIDGEWYCDGYPVDIEECGISAFSAEGNVIEIYNIPIEKTYEKKNSDIITRCRTRAGEDYNFTDVTVIYNIFSADNFKGVTTRFYSEGNMCGGAKVTGTPGKNYWHEVHIGNEHGYYRTGFSQLAECDNTISFGSEEHIGCFGAENVSPGLLIAYPAEKNITEIRLDGKIPNESVIYIFGVRAVEE